MDVGRWVRSLRHGRGITQAELAVRAGTTQAAISKVESGVHDLTVGRLEELAACMGYELRLDAVPMEPWTDPSHIADYALLTPDERVRHGLASARGMTGIVGAARDG